MDCKGVAQGPSTETCRCPKRCQPMDNLQNILIGIGALVGVGALLAMIFGAPARTGRFTDADADGEPDETPEQKRRALEDDGV